MTSLIIWVGVRLNFDVEKNVSSSSTQIIRDNSGDKPVLDNDMSKVGSNTPTNMVKSNHSQGETDDFYNRVENGNELSSLNGTMTDIETRDWYHGELDNIDIVEQQMRSQGRSSKEIFEVTTKIRNDTKLQAREFMKNQEVANSLPPPKTPSEILNKYEGSYEKAIKASRRTNPRVNESINERRSNGEQ